MEKKQAAILCAAVVLLAAVLFNFSGRNDTAEQKSVLKGIVCEEELVREGRKVRTGDVLCRVRSVAGSSIAAARADSSGTVGKVLVKAGDTVEPGQTVVILEK